jgi:hypothetical protein
MKDGKLVRCTVAPEQATILCRHRQLPESQETHASMGAQNRATYRRRNDQRLTPKVSGQLCRYWTSDMRKVGCDNQLGPHEHARAQGDRPSDAPWQRWLCRRRVLTLVAKEQPHADESD